MVEKTYVTYNQVRFHRQHGQPDAHTTCGINAMLATYDVHHEASNY
jgi:hypothetical protein